MEITKKTFRIPFLPTPAPTLHRGTRLTAHPKSRGAAFCRKVREAKESTAGQIFRVVRRLSRFYFQSSLGGPGPNAGRYRELHGNWTDIEATRLQSCQRQGDGRTLAATWCSLESTAVKRASGFETYCLYLNITCIFTVA